MKQFYSEEESLWNSSIVRRNPTKLSTCYWRESWNTRILVVNILHSFIKLFRKDFFSLIRINCSFFVKQDTSDVTSLHQCGLGWPGTSIYYLHFQLCLWDHRGDKVLSKIERLICSICLYLQNCFASLFPHSSEQMALIHTWPCNQITTLNGRHSAHDITNRAIDYSCVFIQTKTSEPRVITTHQYLNNEISLIDTAAVHKVQSVLMSEEKALWNSTINICRQINSGNWHYMNTPIWLNTLPTVWWDKHICSHCKFIHYQWHWA